MTRSRRAACPSWTSPVSRRIPDALLQVIEDRTIVGGPPGDAETFVLIGDLLRETYASPALRAALYEVAAGLPGVELIGNVRDASGRPGVAVAYEHDGARNELIFDPETAAMLGESSVVTEAGAMGLPVGNGRLERRVPGVGRRGLHARHDLTTG